MIKLRRNSAQDEVVLDKEEKGRISTSSDDVDCYIIPASTGKLIRRRVKVSDIPDDSIRRDFGFIGYLLGLAEDGTLSAIEPPANTPKNKHPTQYFSYQGIVIPLVQRAIKLPGDTIEKIKMGIFIALIIVELVMLGFIILPIAGG